MRRPARRGAAEAGQAAAELALVLPVLLLLLLGIVEFARAWNVYQVLTAAAREGVRTAVLASPLVDEDSVRAVIFTALRTGALDPARATVRMSGTSAPSGFPAEVVLEYPVKLMVMGLATGEAGASLSLSTSAVMRKE